MSRRGLPPNGGSQLSRRDFVRASAIAGTSLLLGIDRRGVIAVLRPGPASAGVFRPTQWLRIDDVGVVTVIAHRSEMGQGVRTSLPMLIAEELGADWTKLVLEHARPSPSFPNMRTSGSGSVYGAWLPLRRAAAAARQMLVTAAADEWGGGVNPDTCITERGRVVHRPSGREIAFGALVSRASHLNAPIDPPLKDPKAYTLIGTRVARVDAPAIADGRALFGIDVQLPGMRYAVVARSPVRGAKALRWNEEKARAVPGVVDVVAISSGVAVVADRTWTAMRGRGALDVTWDGRVDPAGSSAAYIEALERALARGKIARREGNVDAAFGGAAARMTALYRAPFQAHAAMEPLTCVADVRDGTCEIWVGTQSPNDAQTETAKLLGISSDNVIVNVTLLGGAFGRRIAIDYVLEAVEVSRHIKAPVQVVWTREDDLQHDMYQAAQVNEVSAAIDGAGRIIGWRHRVGDYHLSMFGPRNPEANPADEGDPWGGYDTPYAFPAIDVTLAVLDPPVPTGAWRSVTYPAAVFARETFVDEVAHALHRDPLELRLSYLPSPGDQKVGPITVPNGDRLRRVLQLAADHAGWGAPPRQHADGRKWGRGVACNSFHNETMVAQVADVSVGRAGDIRVHRVVTAIDCGRVINRSGLEAQVESGVIWALSAVLKTQITFAHGQAEQTNFHDFRVLRMNEAPLLETIIVDSDLRPFGAGEPPVPAVGPAVANAVFAATGQRLRSFPLRLNAGGRSP